MDAADALLIQNKEPSNGESAPGTKYNVINEVQMFINAEDGGGDARRSTSTSSPMAQENNGELKINHMKKIQKTIIF